MSDEEDDVTTKRKKLTKKGKTTLADDSSSEDDDLFGSDNEDDEKSETEEVVAVDATFSKENLESAMNDLKPFVSPSIEFSKFLESWDDVDKFVSAKEFYLSDPSGLVKLVSNNDENTPTLELKCLAIAITRQTCLVAKKKDDRGMAQGLFKSKIKANKSMHIGNYVSNTWLIQSVAQLTKMEDTIDDQKNNMHINVLFSGFHFMQDCFVIDNEKKLNVLKEKQNIDWKATTNSILELASSKSLTSLETLAKTLITYLSDFKATSQTAVSATGVAKLSRTSSVDSQALKDATKKKREERMRQLRQKAHGARSMALTPGANTSSMPSAVAPPPAPPSSYSTSVIRADAKNSSLSSSSGYGGDPLSVPFAASSSSVPPPPPSSQHASQDTSAPTSRWNSAPAAPPPAPAPAAPPPASWGAVGGGGDHHQQQQQQQQDQQAYQGTGGYNNAGEQDPRSQPPPISWNDQGAAGNSGNSSYNNNNNYSGGQAYYGSGGGQYDDYQQQKQPQQQQQQQSHNTYDRPVGSGPSDAPANPQYNDYHPNHNAGDSYKYGASGNDNQSAGGGGYDRGGPTPQDRYDENQYRGGGGGGGPNNHSYNNNNNNNNNNKRSRQDAFADDGQGGGSGGMPPRGRGRTLQTWMTNEGGPGGPADLPPPSENLPPPSQSRGPPSGQPPPSFEEPPNLGGGRGRGRTLPAWMTRKNGGPGGP
ncbi:MAG: hypothetical protein SGBAC_009442 [Bacillariaceae sp.]